MFYKIKWRAQAMKSWIKAKWFQLFNGFDYRDTWSLDYSLSKWILPRLKHLKKNKCGTPTVFYDGEFPGDDEEWEKARKKWDEIMDKMIYAFDSVVNDDKYSEACYPADFDWGFDIVDGGMKWKDDRRPDYTSYDEMLKKRREGLELFAKHFENLWD